MPGEPENAPDWLNKKAATVIGWAFEIGLLLGALAGVGLAAAVCWFGR